MLGVRLDDQLEKELAAVARRRGISRSELVRRALRDYLARNCDGEEARRQSVLASRLDRDAEPLEGDDRGWRV